MNSEEEKEFQAFIKEKYINEREKYIITESIWFVEEILDWKQYIFEKLKVKISWAVMLNLKSVKKI